MLSELSERSTNNLLLFCLSRFPFLQFKDWLGEPDKPLEGFPWMSGSDPHTEGIVFWSHLFRAVTADGKEVAVLLVDTQGSFGTSSSTTVSVHIFALSVLISSTQVFNVMRNLQLDHLQHLQMYYKYGKYVQGLEGRTSGFQLCVFLVRDWQWPKEYEFGWEGGERLLQKILGAESKNKATDELRDLRTYFESCLSSRNCFLMPSPGLTDDGCSLNGAVNAGMTPSFNEYLRDFVRGVLSPSKLVVKTVDGEPRTAWELCKFVEKMTPIFSSEKLPEPGLMVVNAAEYCAEIARDKAVMEYRHSLGQVKPGMLAAVLPQPLLMRHYSPLNKKLVPLRQKTASALICPKDGHKNMPSKLNAIFSDVWKSYQDVRKKYEESKKLQDDLIIATRSLNAIARAGMLFVACIPMATIPMAIVAATSLTADLAAIGTGVAAMLINQQNEKDSEDAARKLPADLEKEQS
ncbi:unnamed protein product [Ixodes persulcatus]